MNGFVILNVFGLKVVDLNVIVNDLSLMVRKKKKVFEFVIERDVNDLNGKRKVMEVISLIFNDVELFKCICIEDV